ncbi:MAG: M23 family metallopeptidase [Actinomycetota bacterium]|nr:M23 family metallopeptidase [Actinomycetota bacterium]
MAAPLFGLLAAGTCFVAPVDAPVTDPFRQPPCEWCAGNRGIEFGPTTGHEVIAAAPGTVTFSGSVAGTNYVVVQHADGTRTTYGMLAHAEVGRGAHVDVGDRIAVAGSRLHFGWRDGDAYLDPTEVLGRLQRRPRLIPLDGTAPRTAPDGGRCVAPEP